MLTTSSTARSRPSTPYADRRLARHSFGWEAGLVDVFCTQAARFSLQKGHLEIRTEWAVSNRIADVAVSTFAAKPRLDDPRLEALARLSMVELSVLAGTVEGSANPRQLTARLYLPLETTDRALARLRRMDLVEDEGDGPADAFRATDWTEALPSSLHLIEAKLDDWQEAVCQALNYRRFADAASVVLPLSFSGRAEVCSACEARGIGLILLQADGGGRQVVEPAAGDPRWHAIKTHSYLEILRDLVIKNGHASSLRSRTGH